MPSRHELFWQLGSFAVVGDSAKRSFPKLTYGGLKKKGKTVFAVDPGSQKVAGDTAYPELTALPQQVDGVVLEVNREDARAWVQRAHDAGIRNVWIHQFSDSPEAIALANDYSMNLLTKNCAVMYLRDDFSIHSLHRKISQRFDAY